MDRLFLQSVTVPPGTLQSAPVSTTWTLDEATLKNIAITVPDGHNGLTGIRLLWSNQQIIPWANNQYLVANGRTIEVGFNDYMTVSGLVIQTYNTDIFAHSFYLEALVSDLPSAAQMSAMSGTGAMVLPATQPVAVDPLSPDALIASLPPEMRAAMTLSQGG